MSKYYQGDIEGMILFSGDASDRFGVIGDPPSVLHYYFDADDLEDVENEIKAIETKLGDKKEMFEKFVTDIDTYTLPKGVSETEFNKLGLKDYMDLLLGIKIRDRIKEYGDCSFSADI